MMSKSYSRNAARNEKQHRFPRAAAGIFPTGQNELLL
jgi:hypothetical protein